jgi:hypothetical protein
MHDLMHHCGLGCDHMIASHFQPPYRGNCSTTPKTLPHLVFSKISNHLSLFQLHHSTTIDYPLYIGSSLVYMCIIEYNGPLFLLDCVTLPATGPFCCRVE